MLSDTEFRYMDRVESNMNDAVQIHALIEVRDRADLPLDRPVSSGWGPVFCYGGELFSARVDSSSPAVLPGARGQVVIDVFSERLARIGVPPGAKFELREGPEVVIATGTVELSEPLT